ncbi:MAG: RNA polymerase sigma factor [Acidobacteriia bacterium]|nr:RNA polymerase sigma factor [Terriglobia bacterium]
MATAITAFEDNTLIQRTLAGQQECFGILMARHSLPIKRRIQAMVRNTTEVEDLLQETVLNVWRHLSTFRAESSFRTWMQRVAVNVVLQSFRTERSRPICETVDDLSALVFCGETPDDCFARNEVTLRIRDAIMSIPQPYRQAVFLRHIEGYGLQEIAERLRSSVPAIKSRLHRARRMLAEALKESQPKRNR